MCKIMVGVKTTLSVGVTMISQPISTPTQQIIIMTTFSNIHSTTHCTFSMENLGHAVSKPQD